MGFDKGDAAFQVNRAPGAPNPSIYKSSAVGDVSTNVADLIGEGRVVNFSAGPCCLPLEVLQSAKDDMLSWHGSGCSVLEMSHRSKEYESIIFQAEKDMREMGQGKRCRQYQVHKVHTDSSSVRVEDKH